MEDQKKKEALGVIIKFMENLSVMSKEPVHKDKTVHTINSMIELKDGPLRDEKNLFIDGWEDVISYPANNMNKIENFLAKLEERITEVRYYDM